MRTSLTLVALAAGSTVALAQYSELWTYVDDSRTVRNEIVDIVTADAAGHIYYGAQVDNSATGRSDGRVGQLTGATYEERWAHTITGSDRSNVTLRGVFPIDGDSVLVAYTETSLGVNRGRAFFRTISAGGAVGRTVRLLASEGAVSMNVKPIPTTGDFLVFVGAEGRTAGYRLRKDGAVVWSTTAPDFAFDGADVAVVGDRLYATTGFGLLASASLTTGASVVTVAPATPGWTFPATWMALLAAQDTVWVATVTPTEVYLAYVRDDKWIETTKRVLSRPDASRRVYDFTTAGGTFVLTLGRDASIIEQFDLSKGDNPFTPPSETFVPEFSTRRLRNRLPDPTQPAVHTADGVLLVAGTTPSPGGGADAAVAEVRPFDAAVVYRFGEDGVAAGGPRSTAQLLVGPDQRVYHVSDGDEGHVVDVLSAEGVLLSSRPVALDPRLVRYEGSFLTADGRLAWFVYALSAPEPLLQVYVVDPATGRAEFDRSFGPADFIFVERARVTEIGPDAIAVIKQQNSNSGAPTTSQVLIFDRRLTVTDSIEVPSAASLGNINLVRPLRGSSDLLLAGNGPSGGPDFFAARITRSGRLVWRYLDVAPPTGPSFRRARTAGQNADGGFDFIDPNGAILSLDSNGVEVSRYAPPTPRFSQAGVDQPSAGANLIGIYQTVAPTATSGSFAAATSIGVIDRKTGAYTPRVTFPSDALTVETYHEAFGRSYVAGTVQVGSDSRSFVRAYEGTLSPVAGPREKGLPAVVPYPNPVAPGATLSIAGGVPAPGTVLTDLLGRTVAAVVAQQGGHYVVPTVPSGVYLLRGRLDDGRVFAVRIAIE